MDCRARQCSLAMTRTNVRHCEEAKPLRQSTLDILPKQLSYMKFYALIFTAAKKQNRHSNKFIGL